MVRLIGEKPELGDYVCEFSPLGSGVYRVTPEGLGVEAVVQTDGSRVLWVIFQQGPTRPTKRIAHYLYAAALPPDQESYLAVLEFVSLFQPVVGAALDEAMTARRVLILGGPENFSAADEAALIAAGAVVERLSGPTLAVQLRQRLAAAHPF